MNFSKNILAIGAHPDDVEAGATGLLLKAVKAGWNTYAIDLTQGELSDSGTGVIRAKESQKSAKILGLEKRFNCKMPDGNILINNANKLKLITLLRQIKPNVVLIPYWNDRHPDHKNASELAYQSVYSAKYQKINTKGSAWNIPLVLYYQINEDFIPTIVIDITEDYFTKLTALQANESQYPKKQSESFFEYFTAKARYFGEKINVRYGEPYISKIPLSLKQIQLLNDFNNEKSM